MNVANSVYREEYKERLIRIKEEAACQFLEEQMMKELESHVEF